MAYFISKSQCLGDWNKLCIGNAKWYLATRVKEYRHEPQLCRVTGDSSICRNRYFGYRFSILNSIETKYSLYTNNGQTSHSLFVLKNFYSNVILSFDIIPTYCWTCLKTHLSWQQITQDHCKGHSLHDKHRLCCHHKCTYKGSAGHKIRELVLLHECKFPDDFYPNLQIWNQSACDCPFILPSLYITVIVCFFFHLWLHVTIIPSSSITYWLE